jgi:hypothetical protein
VSARRAPPAAAPELAVAITKRADGGAVLRLTRADGTATWQHARGATGAFFPAHDLTHYAVETELGHRRGFYGLVVEGWDVGDFGAPWPRGRLDDADPSELIVGFLDRTGLDDAGRPRRRSSMRPRPRTSPSIPGRRVASGAGGRSPTTSWRACGRGRAPSWPSGARCPRGRR